MAAGRRVGVVALVWALIAIGVPTIGVTVTPGRVSAHGRADRRPPGMTSRGERDPGMGEAARTAIYEVLVVDAAMRSVLLRDATESAILSLRTLSSKFLSISSATASRTA